MDRYKILDSRMVGTTPMMVAAKVVVDQAITAPPILATFYTGLSILNFLMFQLFEQEYNVSDHTSWTELFHFQLGMSLMEGKEDIFAECREKFWPTLMVSSSSYYINNIIGAIRNNISYLKHKWFKTRATPNIVNNNKLGIEHPVIPIIDFTFMIFSVNQSNRLNIEKLQQVIKSASP